MASVFLDRLPVPEPPPAPAAVDTAVINEHWPLYFVARPGAGRNGLKVGALFPLQEKQAIRDWGTSYGLSEQDARHRSFSELDYVEVLAVQNATVAERIISNGYNIQQARALLEGEGV